RRWLQSLSTILWHLSTVICHLSTITASSYTPRRLSLQSLPSCGICQSSSAICQLLLLPLIHHPVLHYKTYFAHYMCIGHGVAVNGNNIGKFSCFNSTHFIAYAYQV